MTCVWGDQTVELGKKLAWQLDDRSIVLHRQENEWVVWDNKAPIHSSETIQLVRDEVDEGSDEDKRRILQKNTEDEIRVDPLLADRSFLVRPGSALIIAPNDTVEIYVSTPLWFSIKTKMKKLLLIDVPLIQPSDAWFGPSTLEGELCYAKFTDATTDVQSIEWRCHRAVTKIVIHNVKKSELLIERINVPVTMLSLNQTDDGKILTESLIVKCDADDKTVDIVIEKQPPQVFGKTVSLAEPRTPSNKRNLIKNLTSILG